MSKRVTIQFGWAVTLVLCCGAASAGPLAALPTSAANQPALLAAPSLAAAPSSLSALPALPHSAALASTISINALNTLSPAALPGLEGVADSQQKVSATKAGISTNGIRPIRVPGNINLPIPIPGFPDLQL